jgi:hypothetical protein
MRAHSFTSSQQSAEVGEGRILGFAHDIKGKKELKKAIKSESHKAQPLRVLNLPSFPLGNHPWSMETGLQHLSYSLLCSLICNYKTYCPG